MSEEDVEYSERPTTSSSKGTNALDFAICETTLQSATESWRGLSGAMWHGGTNWGLYLTGIDRQ